MLFTKGIIVIKTVRYMMACQGICKILHFIWWLWKGICKILHFIRWLCGMSSHNILWDVITIIYVYVFLCLHTIWKICMNIYAHTDSTENLSFILSGDTRRVPEINSPLTQLSLKKMATVSQITFLNVFSWMENFGLRFKLHWSLLPGAQLTISQHWFRQCFGA